MKLRNKKTGEIMQGLELSVIEYGFGHEWMRDWSYNSIKAFLEDWEDVKENSPAEPLIKDEKIRKAVRAWADANNIKKVALEEWDDENIYFIDSDYAPQIWFPKKSILESPLDDGKIYTIAELCGEEEE